MLTSEAHLFPLAFTWVAFVASLLIALALQARGRLRLARIAARCAIGAIAFGYLAALHVALLHLIGPASLVQP